MSAITLWALAAAAGAMAIWWWRRRDRIVSENGVSFLGPDDPDMVKAIAAARDRFPMFVERLRAPQPGDSDFAIKVGVKHGEHTEHLWLGDIEIEGDRIAGIIGNDPQTVPLKLGDRWEGDASQLSDWLFLSDGLMQGNFTLRAMLPRMPKRDRKKAKQMLDWAMDTRELVHRPWPGDATMPGTPTPDVLSDGDRMLMDGIADHLERHFGKIPRVFHEIVSSQAHIDLYPYPADAQRPFHLVVTSGMAERPMRTPHGDIYAELVLLLPPEWSLDSAAWRDERHYWPFRWLKRVARFPYETGHWLDAGHLLTHGAEPTPIHSSKPVDSVLLAPARRLPESFARLRLSDGREVRILMIHFLDPATRARVESAATLDARLAAVDADRLSL